MLPDVGNTLEPLYVGYTTSNSLDTSLADVKLVILPTFSSSAMPDTVTVM